MLGPITGIRGDLVAKKSEPGPVTIQGFKGIDLRLTAEGAEPNTMREATNVDLTTGGGVKSRDQIRAYAEVSANSLGLYVIGGKLRCAMPVPTSGGMELSPSGVTYDYFTDTTTGNSTTSLALRGAESWQQNAYIVIEKYLDPSQPTLGFSYDHHYCLPFDAQSFTGTTVNGNAVINTVSPDASAIAVGSTVVAAGSTNTYRVISSTATTITLHVVYAEVGAAGVALTIYSPISTKVSLPFSPGKNLFLLTQKMWANDITTNDVWYSSSINGPTDWTNSGDAGFIPVSKHAPADQVVRGFGVYGAQLCVYFIDSIQLWNVSVDPADFSIADIVGGAGTEQNGSIANVMGSPIYFAKGGFRNLETVAVTGQNNDADVGSNIYPLTKTLDLTGKKLVSVWSAIRAQYMCAIGDQMYVFTNSPNAGIQGWTTYTLPAGTNVTDMVELDGEVYYRSGSTIYTFDSAYASESGFAWTCRFPYLMAGAYGFRKSWFAYEVAQSGTQDLLVYPNARDESITYTGPTIIGSSYGINHIPLMLISESISPRMSGTGTWRMDNFTFRVKIGNS
jgi:hypothetical protein